MTTGRASPVAPVTTESTDRTPRTERGRKTLRKLLDAAAIEFGERGFHETSITAITGRAGTALGSFYTYFESKEELFQALVRDLSGRVAVAAREALEAEEGRDGLATERAALAAFLRFAREHKEIYRIIDESEFVDPASFRTHYETTARRIHERLAGGTARGEFRDDLSEAHAWAIMGMNVFLGLRYAVWSEDLSTDEVAGMASDLLRRGISSKPEPD